MNEAEMRFWRPGDQLVVRSDIGGRAWELKPHRVVEDSPEWTVLYLPEGTPCRVPSFVLHRYKDFIPPAKDWQIVDWRWRETNVLALAPAGKHYAAWLLRNPSNDAAWCWYVNFQKPMRGKPHGLDTRDLTLDFIFFPDGTLKVKDQAEYDEAVRSGTISPLDALEVEKAREEVLALHASRSFPFEPEWLDWRPEEDWAAPTLPAGYEALEVYP